MTEEYVIGERVYRLLFPDLLRPLSPDELADLEESITVDGIRYRVLIDEQGGVIDGGHRIRIAARLGLDHVPVEVMRDLSEEGKRRLALSLNTARRHLTPDELQQRRRQRIERVAEARKEGKSLRALAEKEGVSLGQVQRDLEEASGVSPDTPDAVPPVVTGRDGKTYPATKPAYQPILSPLPELSFGPDSNDDEEEDDPEDEQEEEESRAREATVRQPARDVAAEKEARERNRLARLESAPHADGQSAWQVVTGDCVEVLGAQPEGCTRLIFADPPYNVGIDYGDGSAADSLSSPEYIAWADAWLRACRRLLTPDGTLWVLINDEYAAEYVYSLKEIGFTLRNWVIWYEAFGVNCPAKFNRTKRHLLYAVVHPERFVFNREHVNRPSDRQVKYDDPRANPDGKTLDDVWTDIPRLAGTHTERIPGFPTQLPLALLDRVVGCCSDLGDLVIDPFNGSGTTGVAAIRLGRRYLGVERNPTFADLARLRLRAVCPRKD